MNELKLKLTVHALSVDRDYPSAELSGASEAGRERRVIIEGLSNDETCALQLGAGYSLTLRLASEVEQKACDACGDVVDDWYALAYQGDYISVCMSCHRNRLLPDILNMAHARRNAKHEQVKWPADMTTTGELSSLRDSIGKHREGRQVERASSHTHDACLDVSPRPQASLHSVKIATDANDLPRCDMCGEVIVGGWTVKGDTTYVNACDHCHETYALPKLWRLASTGAMRGTWDEPAEPAPDRDPETERDLVGWAESLRNCIAFDSMDWGACKRHAFIYGIVLGWDEESLFELATKHKWDPATVHRLRGLRAAYAAAATHSTAAATIPPEPDEETSEWEKHQRESALQLHALVDAAHDPSASENDRDKALLGILTHLKGWDCVLDELRCFDCED